MSEQLVFPGIVRRVAPQPVYPWRAKRDWTKAEFYRALARNGITPMEGGIFFIDATGRKYVAIYKRDPIRVARRATLASILHAQAR
jgi:hypothetical protein